MEPHAWRPKRCRASGAGAQRRGVPAHWGWGVALALTVLCACCVRSGLGIHLPAHSPLDYVLRLPAQTAARIVRNNAHLRKLRADMGPEEYDCSSLDGPVCLPPLDEATAAAQDAQDLVVNLAGELHSRRYQATPPMSSLPQQRESGMRTVNSLLERAAAQQGQSGQPNRPKIQGTQGAAAGSSGSGSGTFSLPPDPEAADFAAAVIMAARDVQCSLCRAIARDVFWSAAESRSRGQPATLPWLQTAVENSCKGQMPSVLGRHSIVPRGVSSGYALGERGEPRTLSGFEAAAFKRACEQVVDTAGGDVVDAVFSSVERGHELRTGAANSVSFKQLYDMQAAACHRVRCAPEEALPVINADQVVTGSVEGVLAEMHEKCIYLSHGWWTYEEEMNNHQITGDTYVLDKGIQQPYSVCHKQHIRQFHVDRHKTQDSILLGRFDEISTANAHSTVTPRLEATDLLPGMREALRYHSHVFTQGDHCEVPGMPGGKKRRTQVRFACPPDGQVHLVVHHPRRCPVLCWLLVLLRG